MPISHWSAPGHDLFVVVYSGSVGLREILRFFDAFEPDFIAHPVRDELCDARALAHLDLTRAEFDDLVSLLVGIYRRNGCAKRIAIVTGTCPAAFILNQVVARFATELPEVQAATFETLGPALSHLGVTPGFRLNMRPN